MYKGSTFYHFTFHDHVVLALGTITKDDENKMTIVPLANLLYNAHFFMLKALAHSPILVNNGINKG